MQDSLSLTISISSVDKKFHSFIKPIILQRHSTSSILWS